MSVRVVSELRCAFKIRKSETNSSYVGGLWTSVNECVECAGGLWVVRVWVISVDECVERAGEVWGVHVCMV